MWTRCNGKVWGKDLGGPESNIYRNSFSDYTQVNINGWMFEFLRGHTRACAASNDWGWVFKEAA